MRDDSRTSPDTTDYRDASGHSASGNPAPRSVGHNKVTRAAEALLGRDCTAVTEKAIELTLNQPGSTSIGISFAYFS